MKRVSLRGFALLMAVAVSQVRGQSEPLPSWNEGPARQSIVQFVQAVTDRSGGQYVPPAERIAVFDNDGTLWLEQPMYTQMQFAFDRVRAVAAQHPEWLQNPLYRAIIENDAAGMAKAGLMDMLEMTEVAHAGLTSEAFSGVATEWLSKARHPRFNRPYTELVYQPMLEVLAYLRANGFKTYIVSGGGLEFMRPWTEKVYGIPPEQVIGSWGEMGLETRDGKRELVRRAKLGGLVNEESKAASIYQHLGRRPIAAFGNSDGDLPMEEWTASGPGARLVVVVHHTDAEREYAYDKDTKFGTLNKGLQVAREKGWTVVDMKKDWKQVFPDGGGK